MEKLNLKRESPHIGRNIMSLRNLKGIKQDALSAETGIPQSEISIIENSRDVDEEKLSKIAEALNLTPEIIKAYNEAFAFYSIDNKLENVKIKETAHGIHQVFSPIEKVVELYERLLASEKEKIELLKKSQQK